MLFLPKRVTLQQTQIILTNLRLTHLPYTVWDTEDRALFFRKW